MVKGIKPSDMWWKEQTCVCAEFTFMFLNSHIEIEGSSGDQKGDSAPNLRRFSPTPQGQFKQPIVWLWGVKSQDRRTSGFWFPRITSNHLLCHYVSANGDIQANVLLFPVTEAFERLSSTNAKRGWHVNVVLTWLMQHYLLFTRVSTLLQT